MTQAAFSSEIIGEAYRPRKGTNVAGRSAKQLGDNEIAQVQQMSGHQEAPSYAKRYSEDAMANPADAITRTKADSTDWLKDNRRIAKEVRLALVSDFDHLRAPRKEIAKHAQCSHRTVEAWTDPELPTVPGLPHFLRLVPRSPSIQKLLIRLMTLDADIDPEHQRAFMDLVRTIKEASK